MLSRDFEFSKLEREQRARYKLDEFHAFTGEDDHLRHEHRGAQSSSDNSRGSRVVVLRDFAVQQVWETAATEILAGIHEPDEHDRRAAESLYGAEKMLAHMQRQGIPLARFTVDQCEVRLHGTTLYNSLFRYDDTLLVNPHIWGQPASANPVFQLRRVNDVGWFDNYAESFDAIWADAQPWIPD